MTNSTVSHNQSDGPGGGILIGAGTVTLHNTILAQNTALEAGPDCFGVLGSLGHNLLGDLTDCSLTLEDTDRLGDPGLDAFTDDGTPGHGHFPLLPTSPAIDAGDAAVCPPTDQLGQPRVGVCDIGAIEFQPLSCLGTGVARLRGRVRVAHSSGLPEVTLTLTGLAGCRDTTLTTSRGRYVFRTLGSGTYTLIPEKAGCTFSPPSQTVTLAREDHLVRAKFHATCPPEDEGERALKAHAERD